MDFILGLLYFFLVISDILMPIVALIAYLKQSEKLLKIVAVWFILAVIIELILNHFGIIDYVPDTREDWD